ncbi:MAG: GH116 family glycosyl hydrolase [Bacteroidota bacterium]|nr:GH116 family glycosyl hydrolase [Bacteroidota bacterium]
MKSDRGMTCVFFALIALLMTGKVVAQHVVRTHSFNRVYGGASNERVAFPIGGIGAGMFCLEGTGTISHFSVRNRPDLFNEPGMFAAIAIRELPGSARVLEGPVPAWKKFGLPGSAMGSVGATYGLARFAKATFVARFPFGEVSLDEGALPLRVSITGWSPFLPTDADNSSLPVGALEYHFTNTGAKRIHYVFSFNSRNCMTVAPAGRVPPMVGPNRIRPMTGGFVLSQEGTEAHPEDQGDFAVFTDEPGVVVDHCWFRGGWWDPLSMAWDHIAACSVDAIAPVDRDAPGASLFVPFVLRPGESKVVRVYFAWYVPHTRLRYGRAARVAADSANMDFSRDESDSFYSPWYSSRFSGISEVATYWRAHYTDLRAKSMLFQKCFYRSTLPPEVIEAIAANLTILKSPTVLRQSDGRFWGWEGCNDYDGSCAGNCTHVYNYAQALCHLFPDLERSIRETELHETMDGYGHQNYRTSLPIKPAAHNLFLPAADGQLGEIMRLYRDWRISGNTAWMKGLYRNCKVSMEYCIRTWDPDHTGSLVEPHHTTYDIEFWGPDGMCTGIYLGALEAMIRMGEAAGDDVSLYRALLEKGRKVMETQLFNGHYFIQRTRWDGLRNDPMVYRNTAEVYEPPSSEALQLFQREGPRYQYGSGCLSDGVFGAWLTRVCGLPDPVDTSMISRHLLSVYHYNEKHDLSGFSNPQRPGYALGKEGGLLLCSWPQGGAPSLPFVYSNEVWTGIEYEVASHLIMTGHVQQGLDIVRTCRRRYDGSVRNPFDEYECGHWYARALSSYALLQALTGLRYDAVDSTLYIDSKVGDFTCFLCTATGFGYVVYHRGKVTVNVAYGKIEVTRIVVMESNNRRRAPGLATWPQPEVDK